MNECCSATACLGGCRGCELTFRDAALSVDGNAHTSEEEEHVRGGRWGWVVWRGEDACFQGRRLVWIRAGSTQLNRRLSRGVGATYADSQARTSLASTAHTPSR